MIKLKFQIKNNKLERTDSEQIISKSKHLYKAIFEFEGRMWKGVEKIAIFTDSWGNRKRVYIGRWECKCVIPDSILQGTFFKVTVYGGDLITTNDISIPLVQSDYNTF